MEVRERADAEAGEPRRDQIPDERPLLEAGTADERDPQRLGEEPGEPDHEECTEDHRVLRFGLDADAVRTHEVAPANRPEDSRNEHHAREVRHELIALVDVPMEELEVVGKLVVDLEHDGGGE